MKQYQYKIYRGGVRYEEQLAYEKDLNIFGRQGWRIVFTCMHESYLTTVLEREASDLPPEEQRL